MEIRELAGKLEELVNAKLDAFTMIGKIAKDLSLLKGSNAAVEKLFEAMYEISLELQPVEFIIKHEHPEVVKLFKELSKHKGDSHATAQS